MSEELKKIEEEVMGKIKSGRVELRSKYLFLAEKLGLQSAAALSFILAVLFFSLIFYYIKESGSLTYLSFGRAGIFAFLESFPYLQVVFFIIFLFAVGFLINKSDLVCKRPFKYLAVGLIVIVLFIGSALAYTGVLEQIEERAFSEHISGMMFRPFFGTNFEPHERGMAGKIYEVGADFLIIETPRGFEKINIENLKFAPKEELAPDKFIMAIGKKEGDLFSAEAVKILKEGDMPMVGRGIHRRFNSFYGTASGTPSFPPHMLNFDETTNECLGQCFNGGTQPKKCFSGCMK